MITITQLITVPRGPRGYSSHKSNTEGTGKVGPSTTEKLSSELLSSEVREGERLRK